MGNTIHKFSEQSLRVESQEKPKVGRNLLNFHCKIQNPWKAKSICNAKPKSNFQQRKPKFITYCKPTTAVYEISITYRSSVTIQAE